MISFGTLAIAVDDECRLIEVALIMGDGLDSHVTLAGEPAPRSRVR